jgi:hypothetical protein
MNRVRSMVQLVARMLTGAVIGVAVVVLFFAIDFVGSKDKRLYFIDNRDAFVAALTLGVMIGVLTGIGWAISSKYLNRQTPFTQTENHDSRSR